MILIEVGVLPQRIYFWIAYILRDLAGLNINRRAIIRAPMSVRVYRTAIGAAVSLLRARTCLTKPPIALPDPSASVAFRSKGAIQ